MKLSVVTDIEKQSDFVSKVSEYANTQNKINKSDFFSNSPFHKEFKNLSKRIFAPTADGSQFRTHWFYERVRGEYLNEQAYLTPAKKRQFQLENPKNQLLDKTFLSKSENAWQKKPYIVAKGAQYSFSEFAKVVTNQLEQDNFTITENYFKDCVCRVILFRSIEKMISKASWYDGGFRAQTVAYSISYLSHHIGTQNKFLNFECIWQNQNLPQVLISTLEQITESIYKNITHPPEGFANIAQWCKKEKCWSEVKNINLVIDLKDLLIKKEDEQYIKKSSKKIKKLDTGIEIQSFVIQLKKEDWLKLQEYYQKDDTISPMKLDILSKYCAGVLLFPSVKQAKILYELHNKAIDEGFVL